MRASLLFGLLSLSFVSAAPHCNQRQIACLPEYGDDNDAQFELKRARAAVDQRGEMQPVLRLDSKKMTPTGTGKVVLTTVTLGRWNTTSSTISTSNPDPRFAADPLDTTTTELLTFTTTIPCPDDSSAGSTSTSSPEPASSDSVPAFGTSDSVQPVTTNAASPQGTSSPCDTLTAATTSPSVETSGDERSSTAFETTTTTTVIVMTSGNSQPAPPPTQATPSTDLPPGESFSPLSSLTESQTIVTTTTTIETSVFNTIISTSLVTSYMQSTTESGGLPQTTGSVPTTIPTAAPGTSQPFPTSVVSSPSASVSPITTGSDALSPTPTASATGIMSADNIFQPLATSGIPSNIPMRGGHPVPRLGINQNGRVETNKFYANFFLGNRTQGTWTHPYSVAWAKGNGNAQSWGLSVSHIDRSQLVYGPGDPAQYFINPVGIQSMILSASQLGPSTALTMDGLGAFSANVSLAPVANAAPVVTFPLVQGMGFVTGVYSNGTPLIQSSVFFSNLTYGGLVTGTKTARYTAVLADGTSWLIYLTGVSNSAAPTLTLTSNSAIVAAQPFSGSVQIAKNPNGLSSQAVYDASAGVYPLRGKVAGQTLNATGTYQLSWTKGGSIGRTLLMFALPHHIETLPADLSTQSRSVLQLETTTKGIATAIAADFWTLTEHDLPYDMGFAPWSPSLRSRSYLPQSAVSLIQSVSSMELAENFTAQTDLDSMYFSGKGLAKFAMMIYAANDMARNYGAASAGLVKLKTEFSRFVNNTQIFPLVYDTVWGGAVSSCTYTTGNDGCDFGNTYYNDHHFHYGYFVYTAAVIAHLDPSWLGQGTNQAWVNMLVRDYANPSSNDTYFPFSRMFDWYHGHSWAHGLYETADGKDEESSSEDAFSSYALKMWGHVTGDATMEARGNLMLAITARSLQNYFLMETNNTVQPPKFIGNRAVGILFENKIDHTTYFGTNIEYIEGIHMLPLNPSSTLTRTTAFVSEEWDQYFSNGRADQVAGGWRGILYANLAIIDPQTSYAFFAQDGFDPSWLDGGASRTWYLALAAALGGVS